MVDSTKAVTMNRRVVLLGASLAIDSVAAALTGVPGLELLRFESLAAKDLAHVRNLSPDAVIFDMAVQQPDRPLLKLMTQSGLLLVGFDLATQQMHLFSGKRARLVTVDDLVRALTSQDERNNPHTG
jgi:hypothetical protein